MVNNIVKIGIVLFIFFFGGNIVFSQPLTLKQNTLYLLNFDDNIHNFYSNRDSLESQLINTIYSSNQLLLLLKKEEGILQVKTENGFYKFEVKSGLTDDYENLIEVDFPPSSSLKIDLPVRLGEE